MSSQYYHIHPGPGPDNAIMYMLTYPVHILSFSGRNISTEMVLSSFSFSAENNSISIFGTSNHLSKTPKSLHYTASCLKGFLPNPHRRYWQCEPHKGSYLHISSRRLGLKHIYKVGLSVYWLLPGESLYRTCNRGGHEFEGVIIRILRGHESW